MALFVAPKTWALNEILASADLNALNVAIAASVNAIVDAQVAGGANIQGSKIASAPNGINTAQLGAAAVITGNLAQDATIANQIRTTLNPASFNGTSGTVIIAATGSVVVTRNGSLLILAHVSGYILPVGALRTVTFTLERLNGGTTVLATVTLEASPYATDTGRHPIAVTIPFLDDSPGADTYTYRIRGVVDGAITTVVDLALASIDVMEMA